MKTHSQRGFSLLEMMVVVIILLILSAIAIPSLLQAIRNYRTEAGMRNLSNMILRARYEAAQQNQPVSMVVTQPFGALIGQQTWIGVDVNSNQLLDAGEPRVNTPTDTWFWVIRTNTNDPDYTVGNMIYPQVFFAWPYRMLVTFFPDGTVVVDNPANTLTFLNNGNWSTAPGVQGISVFRRQGGGWVTYGLITVTPTGRIRLWRFQPGAGWTSMR